MKCAAILLACLAAAAFHLGAGAALAARNLTINALDARIAYGTADTQAPGTRSHPFVASITDSATGAHFCTGSLIHASWVVTAAHCKIPLSRVRIRMGSPNRLAPTIVVRAIRQVYPRAYDSDGLFGDVMLYKLARPVTTITPLALPTADSGMNAGERATAMGWGETHLESSPNLLQYVAMPFVSWLRCSPIHLVRHAGLIPSDHLCFGLVRNSRVNTCQGDSGGPYVFYLPGGTPLLVGIVSYGDIDCGKTRRGLDVPTSAFYWTDWIDAQIAKY